MSKRYPIEKGLQGDGKVFKVGPVALDKRQGYVLFGAVALYWFLYKQLTKVLPLSTWEGVLVFSPLLGLAVIFAYLRIDGRHVDHWVLKSLQYSLGQKIYLWKRLPGREGPNLATYQAISDAASRGARAEASAEAPTEAPRRAAKAASAAIVKSPKKKGKHPQKTQRPTRDQRKAQKAKKRARARARKHRTPEKRAHDVRDSVQRLLGIDGLYWRMLRTEEGIYLIVVEVEPVALSLTGADDQDRVLDAIANLYNRLNFELVEITRTREGDIARYTDRLKQRIIEVVGQNEHNLALFGREHLRAANSVTRDYNFFERKSYFVITHRPQNPRPARRRPGALGSLLAKLGLKPTDRETKLLQKEANEAYSALSGKLDVVVDACADMNARARTLTGYELLDFVKSQTSGDDLYPKGTPDDPEPAPFSPITLEVGGYADLTDRHLAKKLAALEKVRGAADPVPGLGDLTFSDKVAADAMRVHADFVKVGSRYHATLFCFDYGPNVGFGDLRSVLNIPGRIKLVKYVKPIVQDKAVRKAGTSLAEVEAAARTADTGDVIAENKRRNAAQHAQHSLNELQSGSQALFEVSLLIHCEAESRDEIYSLVDKVKRKLAGQRIETKLARYEALEGFKSCLPLGVNHLEGRYAKRNLMTYPLSCFFLHGTYSVDHKDGILLGLDYYSGGLVVLDNRQLVNYNMTIIGTSGGGKTVTVKAMATRLRLLGHRIVILDPVGDSRYGPAAAACDGAYVPLGVGSTNRINPLDLSHNYMNISIFAGHEDNVEEEEQEKIRDAALAGALQGKCLMLARLVELMRNADGLGETRGADPLSGAQRGQLDKAFHDLYRDFGITEDPKTHRRKPPTMQDFFKKIREPHFVKYLGDLPDELYSWEHGSLKHIFEGHTNVDLSNKFLVLQIAGVQGQAKAAIMYALLDFLNGLLSDRTEPSDCFVDEFWSLLKYPMSAQFAEEMFRSGRARNNAMVAITQQIDEFLGSEAGSVIMKSSAAQLLLKQNKRTAETLDEFVDLSDDQKDRLTKFQKGQGYLVVQENKVPMYVLISRSEERLFNTDPTKDKLYERADAAALAGRAVGGVIGGPADPDAPVAALANQALQPGDPASQARALLADEIASSAQERAAAPAIPPGHPAHSVLADAGADTEPAVPRGKGALAGTPESPADLVLPGEGRPPIYAVVGPDASLVAYNLAGLLVGPATSGDAHDDTPRGVLFVDADGPLSRAFLDACGAPPPDNLVGPTEGTPAAERPATPLADHVVADAEFGFAALAAPENAGLDAAPIVGAALDSGYRCVVVSCGSGTSYANSWLLSASRVLAAGPGATPPERTALLNHALTAERLRGSNGTLLASMGDLRGAGRPDGDAPLELTDAGHALYALPAGEDPRFSESPGSFAAVDHPDLGRAFAPVARALISAPAQDDPGPHQARPNKGGPS